MRALKNFMDARQQKSCSLTRTGISEPQNVLTFKGRANGAVLNRCWDRVAPLLNVFLQSFSKLKVAKSMQCLEGYFLGWRHSAVYEPLRINISPITPRFGALLGKS